MEGKEEFGAHVLMLPWLALGHAIPHMELAKQLCDRGLTVHLCSTPTILSSLKDKLQQKAYSEIQTVEIHLPTIPGLPPHYESTSSLPTDLMPLLKRAFSLCKPKITAIIQTLKPDFLVHDFFPPWASALAHELRIHAIEFVTFNAACYSFYLALLTGSTPPPNLKLHKFESERVDKALQQNRQEMEGVQRATKFMERKERSIVTLKTARFLEGRFLDYIQELTRKKFVPVGTLVTDQLEISSEAPNTFTKWLETKASFSVVFVSFGTEYFMSKGEITEIAFGLESSEQNFIWVIRLLEEEEEEEGSIERFLPSGFLERVKDRGLVVNRWAPQMAILSHPSTGGFLTHCGWGSLCEGMSCGVPFIALPLNIDQPFNARLVIGELGLGLEIEREENGEFRREKVAEGIKRVMVRSEESEQMRRRAKQMAQRMRDEGERGLDELLQMMQDTLCGGREERGEVIISHPTDENDRRRI